MENLADRVNIDEHKLQAWNEYKPGADPGDVAGRRAQRNVNP
jgi:hypothetical protein